MKLDIKHIAKLADLPLTKSDEKKLENQLNETLNYIDILTEVDTNNIKPTAHVTGLENVKREDIAQPSLTQKQALSNTKNHHNGFFLVDAILDNE